MEGIQERAQIDGATLIGDYPIIKGTTTIHFRCKCGTEYQKQARVGLKGLLCQTCTSRRAAIRRIQTSIDRNNHLLALQNN
jgi:hypothetical protein